MLTLDQSFTTYSNQMGLPLYGNFCEFQTFTCGITDTLSQVNLWLLKIGSPTNIVIQIQETTGDKPNGSVLASDLILPESIPTGTAGLVSVTFTTPASLTSGTKYAIVLFQEGYAGNSSNAVNCYGYQSGGYTGGNEGYSTNAQSSWTAELSADLYFATYMGSAAVFTQMYGATLKGCILKG